MFTMQISSIHIAGKGKGKTIKRLPRFLFFLRSALGILLSKNTAQFDSLGCWLSTNGGAGE
jgi:hypothetical protein